MGEPFSLQLEIHVYRGAPAFLVEIEAVVCAGAGSDANLGSGAGENLVVHPVFGEACVAPQRPEKFQLPALGVQAGKAKAKQNQTER